MSVEFISWDRFQAGTQEVSKVLKEFHHLGLTWTWSEIQGSLTAGNELEKMLAVGLNSDGKKRHVWVEARFQRQTKIQQELVPENSVDL